MAEKNENIQFFGINLLILVNIFKLKFEAKDYKRTYISCALYLCILIHSQRLQNVAASCFCGIHFSEEVMLLTV